MKDQNRFMWIVVGAELFILVAFMIALAIIMS